MPGIEENQDNPVPNPPNNFKALREWMTFGAAIVLAVSGIIFWVQNSSNTQFEHIEKDISALRTDMKEIQTQNGAILRLIGNLEGKLDGLKGK